MVFNVKIAKTDKKLNSIEKTVDIIVLYLDRCGVDVSRTVNVILNKHIVHSSNFC